MPTSALYSARAGSFSIAGFLSFGELRRRHDSVAAQDQALVEAGAEVYQTHCAECHGDRLVNPGSQ